MFSDSTHEALQGISAGGHELSLAFSGQVLFSFISPFFFLDSGSTGVQGFAGRHRQPLRLSSTTCQRRGVDTGHTHRRHIWSSNHVKRNNPSGRPGDNLLTMDSLGNLGRGWTWRWDELKMDAANEKKV